MPEKGNGRGGEASAESERTITNSLASPSAESSIALTVYRGARTAYPAKHDILSWAELCDEIALQCEQDSGKTDKCDLYAYGPYGMIEGETRSNDNVLAMSRAIALDLDEDLDLPALCARIRQLGLCAIVHGSPSDDPEGIRKARAYILADGEHSPADAGAVRDSVAALLGVKACASARDTSRIFFVGRLAGTPPRFVERFEGAPLQLSKLARVDPPRAEPPRAMPQSTEGPADAASAVHSTVQGAILGALGPAQRWEGRKFALCGALGGVLRKCCLPKQFCAELVRKWLSDIGDPSVNVENGVNWACGAWNELPERVSGTTALRGIVGNEIGLLIEHAAMLPWRAHQEIPSDEDEAPRNDGSTYVLMRQKDWRHPQELIYIIPALELAPGKVSAVQGFAYTAKTPTCLLMAICVSTGRDFLGMKVKQCNVVYIDHEPSLLTEKRAVRLCLGMDIDPNTVPLHYLTPPEPFSVAYLDELDRYVVEHEIGMVVIDTYSSAVPPENSFNDSSFREWATKLGALSHARNVLVVILVHENKEANGGKGLRGISGHGSLAGALQATIALSRPDEDKRNVIQVSCGRATENGFEPFLIEWHDTEGGGLAAKRVEGAPVKATKARKACPANANRHAEKVAEKFTAALRIQAQMPRGLWTPRKELTDLVGKKVNVGKEVLADLVDAGFLKLSAGKYAITEAGIAADELAIARALGKRGDFTPGDDE